MWSIDRYKRPTRLLLTPRNITSIIIQLDIISIIIDCLIQTLRNCIPGCIFVCIVPQKYESVRNINIQPLYFLFVLNVMIKFFVYIFYWIELGLLEFCSKPQTLNNIFNLSEGFITSKPHVFIILKCKTCAVH